NQQETKSNVIDISIKGVKFKNLNFDSTSSITKIVCPYFNLELKVKLFKFIRKSDSSDNSDNSDSEVVIAIEEFGDNNNDWMIWIELLTRINDYSNNYGHGNRNNQDLCA
ncbi:MAG: hypothetical protein HQK51_16590, partial [Oligoflexia bacterium]|nr:hypothetical protein [Oligoflexia bacterium]